MKWLVKWLVRITALYLVTLVIMFAVVAFTGGASTGSGTPSHEQPSHEQMDPVSHGDYELHRSIGHIR